MKHKINPTVDCVFKAILGNEKKKHLLIHFLNSVLEYHDDPARRIVEVSIMNPYNEREFEQDKQSVVDVKAQDASGCRFHVEIQTGVHPALKERILYTWSAIYHSNIGRGDDYTALQPVVSIWITSGLLFAETEACHLSFAILDSKTGLLLSGHFAVHVLQLPKWKPRKRKISEKDRWMYLFKEGRNADADDPPDILKQSKEMRDVMDILKDFSENQENYLRYQARLQGQMLRNTIINELERAMFEREKERIEKEREREEKERERKEKERAEKEREKAEKEKALKENEKLMKELEELKKSLKK
jgi:predicted transposase/invertase (TIGR01784 family)